MMIFSLSEFEYGLLQNMSYGMMLLAAISFFLLRSQRAPYGRYSFTASPRFGPNIPARFAWFVQELPSFLWPLYFIVFYPPQSLIALFLLMCFLVHYGHRTFIFSLRIRYGKPTKLVSFVMAIIFCMVNGYLQSAYLARSYVFEPSFLSYLGLTMGLSIFFAGMVINIHSDGILRNLRSAQDQSQKIPRGGLFERISAANLFGEIVEWAGFAIAQGFSLPAVAFALFTFANIGRRGKHHHEDYLQKFPDYPKNRKAVIPFLW